MRSSGKDRTGSFLSFVLFVALLVPAACPAVDQGLGDPDDEYESLRRGASAASPTSPGNTPTGPREPSSSAQAGFRQVGGTPAENRPWSGVWWPRKPVELAFMAFSQGLSPFEKYDTIVFNNYRQNPGASAWEADPAHRHNDAPNTSNVDWSGHCNGLAASAILEPEPRQAVNIQLNTAQAYGLKLNVSSPSQASYNLFRDGTSDYRYVSLSQPVVQLTVADQKGWLCESYMTVQTMQFSNRDLLGNRYNRQEIDPYDPAYRDIEPHYFHYLLQAFVKQGRAIVIEVDPGFPVNNHPLFQYESSAVYYPSQRKYSVTTKVWLADYARSYQYVGTNATQHTYTYDLHMDGSGRVNTGTWTGRSVYSHPDFVWIPTSIAQPYSNYTNASLNYRYARYLIDQGRGH